jgi:3-hydroxyacyl-CoA dehydrogenase/enoyl-CoA hydratase/3-hydroxybutyryl-CoA epimerase
VPINDTLEKMVAKGWLGKKSGRGFYVFDGKSEKPAPAADLRFLQAEHPRLSDDATRRDRLVLVMINEAARVLTEGVVESPEDVDFGMIMGTGWAPFRGGPLRYADSLGAAEVVRRLEALMREVAPHFEPAPWLSELARTGRGFYSAKPSASREPHVDQPLMKPSGGPLGERALPRETANML